jgi:hypothetical protein
MNPPAVNGGERSSTNSVAIRSRGGGGEKLDEDALAVLCFSTFVVDIEGGAGTL